MVTSNLNLFSKVSRKADFRKNCKIDLKRVIISPKIFGEIFLLEKFNGEIL